MNPETLRAGVRQYEREYGRQGGPLLVDERAMLKELERRARAPKLTSIFRDGLPTELADRFAFCV
ncbi:hypothetical protein [Streptomyces nodosus]|uniref:hypothetical protein n=1 Tax=Streptomyces nodosus TaxID=40318 RepID=UPI00382E1CDE